MAKNRFRLWLAAIFALALAVRLVHVWQIRAAPFFSVLLGDSRAYDEWAQRIAAGDWLGHEVFYQAPLYPYLLGALYATAGRHLLLVRIVQAAIGSASCVFLALAARRMFSDRAGIAAGLMLALYAPAIFFDGLLQKSTLDVFLICVTLWLISRTLNAKVAKTAKQDISLRPLRSLRSMSFLWLGIVMGLLALTRENAMVLIAVVAGWTLLSNPEARLPNPGRLRRTALFVAGVAIVLVPVAARNAYVGGGFFVTTSQAGPNFFIGNNPKADGSYSSLRVGRGAPEYEREDATALAEFALGRTLTPSEVSSYWTGRALDFITSNPVAWLRLTGRKVALLVNAAEVVDTESQQSHAEWSLPLRILGRVGHFGILVPLAVFGMFATWADGGRRSTLRLLYALLLAYAASVVAFFVFARYRYPLVPMLMLFAAAGVIEAAAMAGIRGSGFGIRTESRFPNPDSRLVAVVVVAAAIAANWPMVSAASARAVTESNLGVALQQANRVDEAIDHYRRAIGFDPEYAPAENNLGAALRARGRRAEAVAAYERALALNPAFAGAHYNLANLLLDEGDPASAAEHFQQAVRLEPVSADVHNNLGIALAGTGKMGDAIEEFRRAIALDPQSAKAYRNLGDALATTGAQAESIDALIRAAQLDPADAATHYDLGGALLEAGKLDAAVAQFRDAIRVNPNFVEAHNNLGIALGSQGKLEEAVAEFQTALKLRPDFADARKNLEMLKMLRARGSRIPRPPASPEPRAPSP